MPIQHVNRKGKTYYLHEGKTKAGKPKYFFSMKKVGTLSESIPEGYEIYENPNAQVFLRKIQPQYILDSEKELIEKFIDKIKTSFRYIIDIKGKVITIFESQEHVHFMKKLFEHFPFMKSIETSDLVDKAAYYQPILRFILEDEKTRIFRTERYCFLGSIDDWIYLDSSDQLEYLAKKFIEHLGKESFYELS